MSASAPPPPPPPPKATANSEYLLCASRKRAFGGGGALPTNFSFLPELRLGGCALPVDAEQLKKLNRDHGMRLLVSCIEPPCAPPPALVPRSVLQLVVPWKNYCVPTVTQLRIAVQVMHAVLTGEDDPRRFLSSQDGISPDSLRLYTGEASTATEVTTAAAATQPNGDGVGAVLVHCFAGKGRTGTCIACYLIAYHDYKPQDALDHVRKVRPASVETSDQEAFLVQFYHALYPDAPRESIASSGPSFLRIKLRSSKAT